MSAKPSPNEERKPGQPFHYKPSALLEPEEGLIERMMQLGMLQVTHPEAAAVLGVSKNTLERFWTEHPTFKEAFEAGKELDKVRLRRTLRMHAQLDAGTARFLAKNQLGLSDDPSKAKLDEQTAKTLKGMTRQEADGRILELKAKLIGERRIVSRENVKDEEVQHDGFDEGHQDGGDPAQRESSALRGEAGALPRDDGSASPQAQGRQVPLGAVQEGGGQQGEEAQGPQFTGRSARLKDSKEAQRALEAANVKEAGNPDARVEPGPEVPAVRGRGDGGRPRAAQGRPVLAQPGAPVGEVGAVAKLEKRLAELEASTVRKNPRKDGAPHTDRTKAPMDAGANTRQEVKLGHAPSRLPGRLGSR